MRATRELVERAMVFECARALTGVVVVARGNIASTRCEDRLRQNVLFSGLRYEKIVRSAYYVITDEHHDAMFPRITRSLRAHARIIIVRRKNQPTPHVSSI